MKVCTRCCNEWTLDAFSPDKDARDGLHSWCKVCQNKAVQERNRRLMEQDPEGFLARKRAIQRAHRERTGNAKGKAYNRARNRALTRLAKARPDEYAALLDEELAAEGLS
jgi:hypothetical protein